MNCRVFVDASNEFEQDRFPMLRVSVFVVGVCLSVPGVARADISAEQTQTPSNPEMEARFNLLVKTGNLARLSGRHDEAATAYKAALDIHRHPVIRGRLGLVLLKLGHPDQAAEELHEALEHGQGVALEERREVAAAFDKAKSSTTWVTVNVSQLGAKVTCDGVLWNTEKGFASFWRFAMPGEHTLRAQLDGFEDAVATFTGKPGDEITLSLNLVPRAESKLPELPAPAPAVIVPHEKRTFPPVLPASNIASDPNYDPHEDPSYGEPKDTKPVKKKEGTRFSVNGGIVTVFGVASWNPAVGGVVGVSLRPKEFLSLGLEGRAAWLTTSVANEPISAMTAGGILSACARYRWLLGCALGHLGVLNLDASKSTYKEASGTHFKPGLGARFGAEFLASSSFSLHGVIDAIVLRDGYRAWAGKTLIVDQPPIMIGGQLLGGWEF